MELRQAEVCIATWRVTCPVQNVTVLRELPLGRAVLRAEARNPACLEVTVEAADGKAALRLARGYCEEALALLRYFAHVMAGPERGARPLVICPVVLARLEGRGFRQARQLLGTDESQRTEMAARLLRALKWVGDGLVESKPTEAFLHFIIALEVLLGSPSHKLGITHALCRKTALLAREVQPEVDSALLYHRVRALYRQRCHVVHQGMAVADPGALAEIQSIVLRLIDGFLTQGWLSRFPRWDDLHHWAGRQPL